MPSRPGWRESVETARAVGEKLLLRPLHLSVAESCTGGMIGAALTATAGSSRYFRGGVIAYDNEVKQRILGVPPVTLSRHGAVSAQTVTAMAAGVAALLGTECAIAVSGIAGPGGGTTEKPVGLVYIGIHYCGRTQAFRHLFDGDREVVRERAVMEGLNELMRVMR